MTYIVYGFSPEVRDDNSDLAPAQQEQMPVVEIYRTEDWQEVRKIANSGGLIDERGIFCPLVRVDSDQSLGADGVVGVQPPKRRGVGDQGLRKSEFDPEVERLRNEIGLRPLPQNSRPSRGEQPQSQDDVVRAVEQSAEEAQSPRRTIIPGPGVSKPQES